MQKLKVIRETNGSEHAAVGTIELFFDLVFVFAITQLSHSLLEDISWLHGLQVGMLLLAMWWLWIYNSWVTNWLNPEAIPVRLMLLAQMVVCLLISSAIPEAFGERALWFGVSFAACQFLRSVFAMLCFRQHRDASQVRNFTRILIWMAVSGVFWIWGGMVGGTSQQVLLWGIALAIEMIGPAAFFAVPGLGRSRFEDWKVDPHHFAERCGLFVIIALGESLLVTGATFAKGDWGPQQVTGLLIAVTGAIAMWWIYFDSGASRATHYMAEGTIGKTARNAYTYTHVLIIAGILLSAVADEIGLVHPDHGENNAFAVILLGPLCYLLGVAIFKWQTNRRKLPPLSHLVGILAFAILWIPLFMHKLTPLQSVAGTSAILIGVALWESLAIRRPSREKQLGRRDQQYHAE